MIVEIAIGLSALVIGYAAGREDNRCGASERVDRPLVDGGKVFRTNYERCIGRADDRCKAGNCTKHCRDPQRCDGACLEDSE